MKGKKILAILCCAAVLMSVVPAVGFTSLAKKPYFNLSEESPNLFVNAGQKIRLSDVSVSIGGAAMSAESMTITSDDANVSVADGILTVAAKGRYRVKADDGAGHELYVTVIAKETDEKEFVLFEEDFEDVADGSLPTGWTVTANADVTDDASLKHDTYVDAPQVKGGKLILGNGVKSAAVTYIYLPELLDSFGNYTVEMTAKQSYVFNNVQGIGMVLRASRETTEAGIPAEGYRMLALRSSSGATSLGIYDLKTASQKLTGKGVFPIGSTRGWTRPDQSADNPWKTPAESTSTGWKAEGYVVNYASAISGTDFTLNMYKPTEQKQFGGDMGPNGGGGWWETYFLKDDPLLAANELEADMSEWEDKREKGAIALLASGSQMMVDAVRVIVPTRALGDANPDNYKEAPDPSTAKYTTQKIGVMSDIHLCEYATDSDVTLKAALEKFKAEGVSAILMGGDTVNTNLDTEYAKFHSIWNSVFPEASSAPTLLAVTGNHEFEQAYYNRETIDDVYKRYMDQFGYDTLNFHKVVNGIHIIGLNSESSAVNGGYTAKTTDWLDAELAAAEEADPLAPIIVLCHESLKNTTYGSLWGSSNTGALYDSLAAYPQVIYMAGHSHFPTENEKCIMQKDFTCVDIPSMQRTCLEDGLGGNVSPNDAFESQACLLLEFKGEEKQLSIHRLKVNKKNSEITEVKTPWTLSLPISREGFTYKADRAETRTAPAFASGAKVEITNATSNTVTIKFPAAAHDDYVHAYNIEVTDTAGASLMTKYFVSDFYVTGSHKTEYELDLEGLPSNSKVVVSVTAMESFGKTSEPITGEAQTAPIDSKSPARNVADFFDVNTSVGFEDNSPYRRQYNVYVKSHPIKLVFDEELRRQVAFMGGWVNYPASQGSLKEITEHFTIELGFRTPAEAVTAGQCLFGNPESGGITVEYTGAGVFQVGAHIGGGYKYIQVPDLEPDTWYHLIYTFDGQKSYVYLNGEKAGETDSVGTVYFNPNVNFLTIGANVNAVGNAAYVFKGHIALARVYTAPVTAEAAGSMYAKYGMENAYNALYAKYLALDRMDAESMSGNDAQTRYDLMDELEGLLDDPRLTEEDASACIGKVNDFLVGQAAKNPRAAYAPFHDAFDNFIKISEKSATGIQWENNTEIKKTLLSKSANTDVYLIYKLPGYIREIELDVLSVAVCEALDEDFKFFVSKDGSTWTELDYNHSGPVPNELSNYWVESTVFANSSGEYSWLKVQLNKFGTYTDPDTGLEANRVNWATVLDDLRVWYVDPDLDIPGFAPGDVNGDGKVNSRDYALVKRYVLKSYEDAPKDMVQRMDVNGDGSVNARDYQLLKRVVLNTYKF